MDGELGLVVEIEAAILNQAWRAVAFEYEAEVCAWIAVASAGAAWPGIVECGFVSSGAG